MTIERQISQFDNAQEFTRLCNAVFLAKYGNDYQCIDGSRSDGGNDGYVSAEKRILAMHCPTKPEQKTDAEYLRKIRSDLAKATALRDKGQFEIETWTFITPRKLSNSVVSQMCVEAAKVQIKAVHQDASFLALEIARNLHILHNFPELQYYDLGETFHSKSDGKPRNTSQQTLRSSQKRVKLRNPEANNENASHERRILEIRMSRALENGAAKTELRSLIYLLNDPKSQLNAILGLIERFTPDADDYADLLSIADFGIQIAAKNEFFGCAALLHAFKGKLKSLQFGVREIEYFGLLEADKATGLELSSPEELIEFLKELNEKAKAYKKEFAMAAEFAKQANDADVHVSILTTFASSAGERATYLLRFEPTRSDYEKSVCKKILLSLKEFCASRGDELGVAYALFNLVNQIRFFGETAEALLLLPSIRAVAEKFADRELIEKSKTMAEKLSMKKTPHDV